MAELVDAIAFLAALDTLEEVGTIDALREAALGLQARISAGLLDSPVSLPAAEMGESASVPSPRRDVVVSELGQIGDGGDPDLQPTGGE